MPGTCDVALARFAALHGLNIDLLNGKPIADNAVYRDRSDPYSVRIDSREQLEGFDGSIQAIRIHRLYRFSNSLVQLAHALHTAKHLAASEIQIPYAWYLKPGITRLSPSLVLVNGRRHFQNNRIALEGMYFYGRTLAPACPDRPCLRQLLLPIRPALTLAIEQPVLPADQIVLHLRSGDLFGPNPHPAYFQPPLALYQRVLQQQAWGHVHMVFEDYGNPVVRALADWCASQRLPLSLHSWGLSRDLALMLRAHTLVVGRGTFMPGVVALSQNAREVHSFGPFDQGCTWGLEPIHNLVYTDCKNEYVEGVRPWRDTPNQRELMLSFPTDQLEVRSKSSRATASKTV